MQLVSIVQILFSLVILSPLTSGSGIPDHISDPKVRQEVLRWHQRTVDTAQQWGLGFGALGLVLGAATTISIGRSRSSKDSTDGAVS